MPVPAIQPLTEVQENKVTRKNKSTSIISIWCSTQWRKILSEFFSTLLFILLGCMTTMLAESALYSALGFGVVLMVNIQIFGHVSGAFMSPAVTIASVIWGATSVPLGIAYSIAQCLGSIAGYGILYSLSSMDLAGKAVCVTRTFAGQNTLQSIGIEVALTTALILINCALWDPVNKDKQESASIKIGLTVCGLILVGGPLTGASMNPVRSLGPAVWTNIWTDHWIFWAGPLLASVMATILYKCILLENHRW